MFCWVRKSDSGSEVCLFTITVCLGFIIWRLKPYNSLLFLFLFELFWWLQRDLLFCCIKVGLFEPQFPLPTVMLCRSWIVQSVHFQLGNDIFKKCISFHCTIFNLVLWTCEKAVYSTEFVKSSVICAKGVWVKGWNLGLGVKHKFCY